MRRSSGFKLVLLVGISIGLLLWVAPWQQDDPPKGPEVSAGPPRQLGPVEAEIAISEREDFSPDRGVGSPGFEPVPREPLEVMDPSGADALRDDADDTLREWARSLSSSDLLNRWLAESALVETFVSAVDQVAEGRAPRRTLAFMRPRGSFHAHERDHEWRIDPASFARYDALTDAFVSIDPAAAARIYAQLHPALQSAYNGLGYPGRSFDERLREAANVLLETPVLDGDQELRSHVGRFQFADPDLERLYDVQKQLLRTGPGNLRRIHEQLRALLAALDSLEPRRD